MNVGLVVIATGRYHCFVPDLWASARQNFMPGCDVTLLLFSDHVADFANCECLPTAHEPWPGPTLHRYRTMLRHEAVLRQFDYLFYLDADMRVSGTVGDEILGDVVATIHPGFAQQRRETWTYERRPQSRAFIEAGRGEHYFCGGFQGGRATRYLAAAAELDESIRCDEERGITAIWHDESHWNRYLAWHPPDVILSPAYCWPDGWPLRGAPWITALHKDHAAFRNS